MLVERIEIAGFRNPLPDGSSGGSVTFVASDTRIQIPLTLAHRSDLGQRKQRLLLLATALKKARRLPEYRREGTLRFAPGLLPDRLRRA